jgi:hypothetical protein
MRTKFLLLSFICLASLAWGQGSYAIEPTPLKPSAPFPAALRDSLDPQGTLVASYGHGQRVVVCELWWSKTIYMYPKAQGPSNANYSKLEKGTLLGVVYFHARTDDAKDQKIRAGYYTMRYVQMPQNKAHGGIDAYPDFLALSPVAIDGKSHETLPLDTLIQLSRRASRTRHPAVISMLPLNPAFDDFPAMVSDEPGNAILQIKLTSRAGGKTPEEIKLAMVIVPADKEGGGS